MSIMKTINLFPLHIEISPNNLSQYRINIYFVVFVNCQKWSAISHWRLQHHLFLLVFTSKNWSSQIASSWNSTASPPWTAPYVKYPVAETISCSFINITRLQPFPVTIHSSTHHTNNQVYYMSSLLTNGHNWLQWISRCWDLGRKMVVQAFKQTPDVPENDNQEITHFAVIWALQSLQIRLLRQTH